MPIFTSHDRIIDRSRLIHRISAPLSNIHNCPWLPSSIHLVHVIVATFNDNSSFQSATSHFTTYHPGRSEYGVSVVKGSEPPGAITCSNRTVQFVLTIFALILYTSVSIFYNSFSSSLSPISIGSPSFLLCGAVLTCPCAAFVRVLSTPFGELRTPAPSVSFSRGLWIPDAIP